MIGERTERRCERCNDGQQAVELYPCKHVMILKFVNSKMQITLCMYSPVYSSKSFLKKLPKPLSQ